MAASSSRTLANICASLSLEDENEEEVVVGVEDVKALEEGNKYVLVGRFVTSKPIKFHIMSDMLASIWRPGKGVMISDVTPNLFLFKFYHEVDVKRVLEDGPWSFENNMLVLKRLGHMENPQEVNLNMAEMWIQAHNLPNDFFTEKVAAAIGQTLGTFVKADKKNFEGSWKSFLRMRLQIDITKPLRRKLKMKKEGGEPFWVDFKYERMPNFCFLCDVIGHTERYCHLLFEGADEETVRPYGSWIRASGWRPVVNVGAQWLISDDVERKSVEPAIPKEVEMKESNSSTQTEYEVRERQSTIEIRGQEIRSLDAPAKMMNRDKSEERCIYEILGKDKATGPGFDSGIGEADQKRKRTTAFLCKDKNVENMEEDTHNLIGSMILPEVGFAGQAHLDK